MRSSIIVRGMLTNQTPSVREGGLRYHSRGISSPALALFVLMGLFAENAVFGQIPSPMRIHINADKVTNPITPWMTGSCIEDVNHEIYTRSLQK